MKKVIIEITKDGWTTILEKDGKKFTERHVKTMHGSKSIEGDFEAEDDIDDELYDALTSFANHDIMSALN
jgi:hypothetical protein